MTRDADEEDLTPAPKKRKGKGAGKKPAPDAPSDDFDLARALAGDYADEPLFLARRPKSDLGNAERFIARHGQDVIWHESMGFAVWDGARFDVDGGETAALARAQRTVKAMPGELAALKQAAPEQGRAESRDDFDKRMEAHEDNVAAFARFCISSGNFQRSAHMLRHVQAHLRVTLARLNADPFLFACPNATLDLSGPVVRARAPAHADKITQVSGARWDPAADRSATERFVEEVLPDADVRDWVQRYLGWALSGDNSEQVAVFFHGDGSNGKSSLLEMLRAVFGEYAAHSNFAIVTPTMRAANQASPDLARLFGIRFMTTSEPRDGDAIDESVIKNMTGGEPLTTRRLNKEPFEFVPCFKPVVAMNPKPNFRAFDLGTQRRIRMVPFTRTFARDDAVFRAIRAAAMAPENRPGVLSWLADGFEAQLRQALSNLQGLIEGEGASLAQVAKTTVFLVSMDDYPKMNEIYVEHFDAHAGGNRPARSAVAVAALPIGALGEVEAWVHLA